MAAAGKPGGSRTRGPPYPRHSLSVATIHDPPAAGSPRDGADGLALLTGGSRASSCTHVISSMKTRRPHHEPDDSEDRSQRGRGLGALSGWFVVGCWRSSMTDRFPGARATHVPGDSRVTGFA